MPVPIDISQYISVQNLPIYRNRKGKRTMRCGFHLILINRDIQHLHRRTPQYSYIFKLHYDIISKKKQYNKIKPVKFLLSVLGGTS
jgi:hypothetical protein